MRCAPASSLILLLGAAAIGAGCPDRPCADVYDCQQACSPWEWETCAAGCRSGASTAALERADALTSCVEDSGCCRGGQMCRAAKCGQEMDACGVRNADDCLSWLTCVQTSFFPCDDDCVWGVPTPENRKGVDAVARCAMEQGCELHDDECLASRCSGSYQSCLSNEVSSD